MQFNWHRKCVLPKNARIKDICLRLMMTSLEALSIASPYFHIQKLFTFLDLAQLLNNVQTFCLQHYNKQSLHTNKTTFKTWQNIKQNIYGEYKSEGNILTCMPLFTYYRYLQQLFIQIYHKALHLVHKPLLDMMDHQILDKVGYNEKYERFYNYYRFSRARWASLDETTVTLWLSQKLFFKISGQFMHSRHPDDMLRSNGVHCKRVIMLNFVRPLQVTYVKFNLHCELCDMWLSLP